MKLEMPKSFMTQKFVKSVSIRMNFISLIKKSLIPLEHRKKGLNLTMMIFHFYKLQMMMMIMNRTNPKSKGVV